MLKIGVSDGLDYDPFGMLLVGRNWTSGSDYRYGFNGKEQDDETYGNGNIYDYGFRIYNSRLGRFLSIDPLSQKFPWYTPYQFAGNTPIWAIDLDGLEEIIYTASFRLKDEFIKLIQSSDLLGSIYAKVSDPNKANDIKVYFTEIKQGPASNGVTTDMLGGFGLELVEKYQNYYGKSDLTEEEINAFGEESATAYNNFMDNLNAMGLTVEELKKMKEDNPNLQVYAIAISTDMVSDISLDNPKELASALKTVFHEVDFHLRKRLEGVNQDGIQDHKDAFEYEKYKEHYTSVGWDPSSRTSPNHEDVPEESYAGKIFKEIDSKLIKE